MRGTDEKKVLDGDEKSVTSCNDHRTGKLVLLFRRGGHPKRLVRRLTGHVVGAYASATSARAIRALADDFRRLLQYDSLPSK